MSVPFSKYENFAIGYIEPFGFDSNSFICFSSNISKELNFVSFSPSLTLESKITIVQLFILVVTFVKLL